MEKALTFNEVTLSPVLHNNQIWIRSVELACALGYKREDSVAKIFRANIDEFTPDMAQVIEITDNAESAFPVKTRVFSPRGCHMVAMLSRTPIAKEFRRWVLDVLDRLAAQETQPEPTPATPLPLSTAESRKPLRALVHAWAQMARQPHSVAWAQVKGHFQLSRIDDMPEEWIPDALAFVQSRIDALPPAEQLALPQGQPLPMYRNGCFYIPSINDNHKAGPREEAFMELWRQWDGRVRAIKDLFNSLVRDIDHRRGDLFPHVISDLGRNADTAFSTDSLTEALYAAHSQAREDFDRSLDLLFRHMRTCLNLSVAMRM